MKQKQLLALSSAFLLWLAWPPMPFTSLILLIALVPLLIAVEGVILSNDSRKGSKIFGLCFLALCVWNTSCIYWVFNSINSVQPAGVALLISLIPFGLGSLLMTVAFWLYAHLRKTTSKLISYAGLICFWIAYEYLHQSWDLSFPWMNLGNGFANTHQLIQWYEFTGVYGGTLWILVANILIFEIYQRAINRVFYFRWVCAAAIWVFAPIILSLLMYARYEEKLNPANVVVVQPNIDPYKKYGFFSAEQQIKNLMHLSDSIGQVNTEYFIWPETAIPDYCNEDDIRSNLNYLTIKKWLGKYKNGNVISGIESFLLYDSPKTPTANFDDQSQQHIDHFNAAIQIENSAKVQFYHKSKLVPGVEQLPFAAALGFLKPIFAGFGGSTGGYGVQERPSVFYSQTGIGVAPVICYESIWGAYVADYVSQGAQFIAIITNDGWWGNTSGKDQHLQYAKLRAIESRRWVARSANTGISAFINQRGDIVQKTTWWAPAALKQDINLNDKLSYYVRHGDYIAYIGCLGVGLFGLFLLFNIIRHPFKKR